MARCQEKISEMLSTTCRHCFNQQAAVAVVEEVEVTAAATNIS